MFVADSMAKLTFSGNRLGCLLKTVDFALYLSVSLASVFNAKLC